MHSCTPWSSRSNSNNYFSRYRIYAQIPSSSSFKWDLFTSPFTVELWVSVVLTLLLLALVFSVSSHYCKIIFLAKVHRNRRLSCPVVSTEHLTLPPDLKDVRSSVVGDNQRKITENMSDDFGGVKFTDTLTPDEHLYVKKEEETLAVWKHDAVLMVFCALVQQSEFLGWQNILNLRVYNLHHLLSATYRTSRIHQSCNFEPPKLLVHRKNTIMCSP